VNPSTGGFLTAVERSDTAPSFYGYGVLQKFGPLSMTRAFEMTATTSLKLPAGQYRFIVDDLSDGNGNLGPPTVQVEINSQKRSLREEISSDGTALDIRLTWNRPKPESGCVIWVEPISPSAAALYAAAIPWQYMIDSSLEQADPRATQMLPWHAQNFYRRGKLKEAAEWYGKADAANVDLRFFLNEKEHAAPLRYALLLAYLNDKDACRAYCAKMLKRFGDARNLVTGADIARACLVMAPDTLGGDILEQLRAKVEAALTARGRDYGFSVLTKGMYHYRKGEYAQAIECLKEARPLLEWHGHATILCKLFEAMSLHRTGQTEAATQALRGAEEHLSKFDQAPGRDELPLDNAENWLGMQLALREARALIKGGDK
jgi:hypothetical protein